MSLEILLDVISWLLLGSGSLVLVGGAVAILRMPTFFTRIHAAGVNETLGPGLILLGLIFQAGDYTDGFGTVEVVIKLAMILGFLVITSPIATHALAKAALDNGVMPGELRQQRQREREEDSNRREPRDKAGNAS